MNETHYTLIYRCEGCFSWDHEGKTGSQNTSEGTLTIGWAQALDAPEDPSDPGSSVTQHDTQGLFRVPVESAVNEKYSEWAGLAPTGTPTDNPTVTPTVTPTATGIPVSTDSFDCIVVGSDAGGIPVADWLSETGNSVLLIEKGSPSSYSYRWRESKFISLSMVLPTLADAQHSNPVRLAERNQPHSLQRSQTVQPNLGGLSRYRVHRCRRDGGLCSGWWNNSQLRSMVESKSFFTAGLCIVYPSCVN